ncbi:ribosomal protein S21 family protein [Striga asiatica]|uniref:Ribosomal protein S21 family protein n=1 Tax=Striga asiatica TaxID=4170 RepID=A0A5A7QNL0_STRAF|nr:ribosomal protein S21 family protein [Striga asiatica]
MWRFRKASDVPRRWPPPNPKLLLKDFKILLHRRDMALARLCSSSAEANIDVPNRANTISIHGDNKVNKIDDDNHANNHCSKPYLLPEGNLKEEVNESPMATLSIPKIFSLFTPSKQPPPRSQISRRSLVSAAATDQPDWSPLVLSDESQSSVSSSSDVMRVVCPSLANANIYFRSQPYNVEVIVGDDENDDWVERFMREVARAGVLQEVRRRRYFESTQEKKKRKSREAANRNRRRRTQAKARPPPFEWPEDLNEIRDDFSDDDDNWEPYEGELPYC